MGKTSFGQNNWTAVTAIISNNHLEHKLFICFHKTDSDFIKIISDGFIDAK